MASFGGYTRIISGLTYLLECDGPNTCPPLRLFTQSRMLCKHRAGKVAVLRTFLPRNMTHSRTYRIPTLLALVATALIGGCAAQPPFPPATPESVIRVSNLLSPAVVRIDTAQEVFVNGKRTLRRGIGSGVIIDSVGHVLTNFHVAGRSVELYVTLASKDRVAAKLVGDDHWTDLAIIQMDMDEIKKKKVEFSFADLGRSDNLLTGQDVMAIGTPFGLNRTVTLGQISNNERTFYPQRMTIDVGDAGTEDLETGDFSNWIQMDTPINQGNSGGPLVDLNGKVVGINTRGGGQNLNFAIPIGTAKPVIAAILSSALPTRKGHVERSDLGLDFKPLQELESCY
jgi:serine protease Do